MKELTYVPLRVHSEYSVSSGIIRLDALLERCVQLRLPAVALTDQSNLFAVIKFYQQALKLGVKPILGCDVWIANPLQPLTPFRVTLLAQNLTGYHNLLELVSSSYLTGQQHGKPMVTYKLLERYSEGLIALNGAIDSDLFDAMKNHRTKEFTDAAEFWQRCFNGRLYLEISRASPNDEAAALKTLQIAAKFKLPLVATNLACFLDASDFEAHEARICINDGVTLDDPKRARPYTANHRLLSQEEMLNKFSDLPQALANSAQIARRCNVVLELNKLFLPIFSLPDASKTPEAYLTEQANKGFSERVAPEVLNDPAKLAIYKERLAYELKIIIQMGFASYFLIVADFINWAKTHGVPVGPGRGSGAGSLVAYTIKITDLDPIRYELLFERFLNPERVSMPDFDVDFCMEGRDRVINYVSEHYGKEKVSQIITYGTMAARGVVRDVGRVLGYPYGFVDKIAKLIPFTLGITLQQALETEALLKERYEKDAEVARLINLAFKLEGIVRSVGKHAGGIVIAPSKLTDFVPLYCEADGSGVISQFDKNDVAEVGLVKFDFLGLRTLTIIKLAQQMINQRLASEGKSISIEKIAIDDKATYELIASANTTGVFQLDSKMARDVIKRYHPDCFEDLIALVAIIRPGVLQSGMLGEMIERKHGRAATSYMHPLLEPILRPTYGIAVYQEQVMQIAQRLAGYTLGSADLLRRAMGKKKLEEMVKHRSIFVKGAATKGVDARLANEIFDQMEKFASYGFNKSHSAAYTLITYQTAWLKTHFFPEFMAAILSVDMDHADKLTLAINELKGINFPLKLPDINLSESRFIVRDGAIWYGLGAIKGVGTVVTEYIAKERKEHGLFKSFADFCLRVDASKVHRNIMEALILAGCFESFGVNRATLMANLASILMASEHYKANSHTGQLELLAEEDEAPLEGFQVKLTPKNDYSLMAKAELEHNLLSAYISVHPLAWCQEELKRLAILDFTQLQRTERRGIWIAGFATKLRNILTRNNSNIGMLTLEGINGAIEVSLFKELLSKVKSTELNQIMLFEGDTVWDEFSSSYRFKARSCVTLAEMRAKQAKWLKLTVAPSTNWTEAEVIKLKMLLKEHSLSTNHCQVGVVYERAKAKAWLPLSSEYLVDPQEAFLERLRSDLGVKTEVVYDNL